MRKLEAEELARRYRRSFALAAENGVRTIAFPAISCGVYHFPPDRAASIAVREIRSHLAEPAAVERVILVAFDAALFAILKEAIG